MKELSRIHIAHLPTPVEFLPALTQILKGPKLWIKRDDQTGLACGGNKTRKLEFLLAQAQAQGARTLITGGAVQSNHCRQTAAAAAKMGLDCILVLSLSQKQSRLPALSGNLLLDRILNAEIRWSSREEREQTLQKVYEECLHQGRKPFLIPYGGSNPIGAAGYAYAMRELIEQQKHWSELSSLDWIIVASSSGGTQAGLVAGAKLFGYRGKILGISIDETEESLKKKVATLATEVCALLGEPYEISPQEILVNDRFLGQGYGVLGEAEINAILTFARKEGVLLDPVYTGRAAAGMLALIQERKFSQDENILFWHTGGMPALFADGYQRILRQHTET